MENLFFDANVILDIFLRAKNPPDEIFSHNKVFISALSLHLLCYVGKLTMPDEDMLDRLSDINIVPMTADIAERAFIGPTKDYEDNVQLHSSAVCLADAFYTADKDLLRLKYFGSTQIKAPDF